MNYLVPVLLVISLSDNTVLLAFKMLLTASTSDLPICIEKTQDKMKKR